MRARDWGQLAVAVGLAEGAGILGSVFTAPAIPAWYASITKPELTPPGWVFAPVWTALFVLMGVASYLVWRQGWVKRPVKLALKAYAIQLALNVLWSALFFGQQNPGAALFDIGALWVMIAVTTALFSRVSRTAAWLMVPYLAWVSFAAYLNYTFWILNK